MKMKLHRAKAQPGSPLFITGCITAMCTSAMKKCQNRSATFAQSATRSPDSVLRPCVFLSCARITAARSTTAPRISKTRIARSRVCTQRLKNRRRMQKRSTGRNRTRSPHAFLRGDQSGGAELNIHMINARIEARRLAKRAKNYIEADRIRAELLEQGVILEDRPDGSTEWRRAPSARQHTE